ncbi:MAG TPA: hypothetical protein VFW33_05520, partial [Gemmataceae bacterium]|nr:hypothetical protein [Gemmataceae bacterium]
QQMLPAFMKALDSPDEDVRNAALGGMRNISTFLIDWPSLTLNKDALKILTPGLASNQGWARLFAAYGLGRLKADAAPAVPDLRAALLKEENMDPKLSQMIRLEILAALAEVGPAALPVLGSNTDKFLDELKDIANVTDDAAWKRRTCAALALGRIAPDKPQAHDTLNVLVRALRLPNFNKPNHDQIDDELSERAAQALIKAGKNAARPLARTCFAEFAWRADEPVQAQLEKQYAARKVFEVLQRIGKDAACLEVKQLLEAVRKNPFEVAKVKEAAQSAYFAVYGKN